MTPTLVITLILESMVIIAYSLWGKKPVKSIMVTGICGNLITQSMLWIALNLYFQNYLVALFLSEILIWVGESLLLHFVPANYLRLGEALLLSLGMNLTSFAVGWFLPV